MLLPYIRIEQHWTCANLTSLAGNQSEQGQLVAIYIIVTLLVPFPNIY